MTNSDDSGIPADERAAVLAECCYCDTQIECVTGKGWDEQVMAAGWEIDGAGDLVCPKCSQSRADLIGEER